MYWNKIFSRFILSIFFATGFVVSSHQVAASNDDLAVRIEVLERSGCSHCETEKEFLNAFLATHPAVTLVYYDVFSPEGKDLFTRVTDRASLPKATPITLVAGRIVQGFDSAETTGAIFEEIIRLSGSERTSTFEEYLRLAPQGSGAVPSSETCDDGTICPISDDDSVGSDPILRSVTIPFTGKTIDVSEYPLPLLASILGFVDGFNPCAMWVLITFLIVLTQVGSRKRLLQIAGLFVVAEALMYYLILNVWYATWDFIGLNQFVLPIVGIIAIGGGLFFLYEWYKSIGTDLACRIVDAEHRSRIASRIKKLVSERFTLLTAIGVIGLAFTVNVIEFACSIGIPQAFTKILEVNQVGTLATQGYLSLYIVWYMFDDLLVFGLALWSIDRIRLIKDYSRWAALVGGILMILLGYFLLFHPSIVSRLS